MCTGALIGPHPVLLANQGRSLNVYRRIDWAASSVASKSGSEPECVQAHWILRVDHGLPVSNVTGSPSRSWYARIQCYEFTE